MAAAWATIPQMVFSGAAVVMWRCIPREAFQVRRQASGWSCPILIVRGASHCRGASHWTNLALGLDQPAVPTLI
jgi:hypothetical protein